MFCVKFDYFWVFMYYRLPPFSNISVKSEEMEPLIPQKEPMDERIQQATKAQRAKSFMGRLGRYLLLTEKRITIEDVSSSSKVTIKKIRSLVSQVFGEDLEVSAPRHSVLGKPNLAISYKKNRENLSKAELTFLTDKVVDDLKERILQLVKTENTHTSPTENEAEEQKTLVKRLIVAEKLQILLRDKGAGDKSNIVEYLSVKQEAFLALARTLCLPAFVVVKTGIWATEQWKNIRNLYRSNEIIEKLKAQYEMGAGVIVETDWDQVKKMIAEAQKLPELSITDPEEFRKTIERLQKNSQGAEVIEAVFRSHHGLLKRVIMGCDVELMQMVIDKGLFKSAKVSILDRLYSNTAITPIQREQLIRSFFHASRDLNSKERIMEYLIDHNERIFAESLIGKALEATQNEVITPDHVPSFSRCTALFLAAKSGNEKLLKQAFEIQNTQSPEQIAILIDQYAFLPQSQGRSLLSFAIEGGNAKMIMGIERAMCRRNNSAFNNDTTYREKKKELMNVLLQKLNAASLLQRVRSQLPGGKPFVSKQEIIKEELKPIINKFPELSYLKEFMDQPTTLSTHVYRELLNLEVSPFHARDARGVEALSRLEAGTAEAMDQLLGTYMTPGIPVDCFCSAEKYLSEMRSPRGYFVAFMTSVGYVIGSFTFAITPPELTFIGANLLTTVGHQTPYGGMAGGLVGDQIQYSFWGKMLADNYYNKFLTQYIKQFPLNGAVGESVVSDTPQAIKIRNMTSINSLDEKNISGSLLQSRIELQIQRNDAAGVLEDLNAIKQLSHAEIKKINWDRIVSLYPDLTLYSDERERILELLFDVVQTPDQLLDLMDAQLALGRRGAELLTHFFQNQVQAWKANGVPGNGEKRILAVRHYEAAMMAAAKLGNLDLFNQLVEIEDLKKDFNWHTAGGTRTSLLHAAVSSKWSGINAQSAKLVHQIYKELLITNTDPNFSPFNLVRGGTTWYNRWLMDKHILEVETLQQAAAFDAELGMDPSTVGSMSHEVLKGLQEAWMPAQVGNLMCMPVRTVLYRFAASMIVIVPHAVGLAFSFAGPVGNLVGRVSAILVLELSVIFGAFLANKILGKSLTQAYQMAVDEWKGHKPLSQLGLNTDERLAILHKKEATHPDLDKLENKIVASAKEEALLGVKKQLLLGIQDLAEAWKYDMVMWEKLEILKKNLENAEGRSALKRALIQADLSPTQRFVIVRRLGDLFNSGL